MSEAGKRLIGAAREMRGALEDEVMTLDYLGNKWVMAEDYCDLKSQLATARNDALEEAAKVAGKYHDWAEREIRALKSETKP